MYHCVLAVSYSIHLEDKLAADRNVNPLLLYFGNEQAITHSSSEDGKKIPLSVL